MITTTWHKSIGIVQYGPGKRCVLLVDSSIVDYYISLIPKYINFNKQKWDSHVSICRNYENPTSWDVWSGKSINFEYSNVIDCDETYLWLNVKAPDIASIRQLLGLPPIPPWRNYFHITLGNFKHV